jgi:small subunit ribosomal protein S6e
LVRGNLITEEIYQLNCQLMDTMLPEKEKTAEPAGQTTTTTGS